jgi:hypothetical protein
MWHRVLMFTFFIFWYLPLGPPPSNSHMWSNASFSMRLFSSLGTLSEGVMSPTIAGATKTQVETSQQNYRGN